MKKEHLLMEVNKVKVGDFDQLALILAPDKKIALRRISKPGQRIYVSYQSIDKIKNGFGISIISTSKGVMTGKEAKYQKVGGEYLCEVY